MKIMGRLLGTVLVLLLLVTTLGSAPSTAQISTTAAAATAPTWRPAAGASFNTPRSTPTDQWRSERRIREAIEHSPAGSYIRFTIFSFDRMNMADALIDAKRRGVHVQILLNNHQFTTAMVKMRRVLGTDRSKQSFMYVCKYGCRSTGENLHTKMYLFSRTGAAKYVVLTGSHNLTANAGVNQWNDLYGVNDDYNLFLAFNELFMKMKKDVPDTPLYYYRNVGSRYQLQVFPYPNFRADNDPMMTILKRIRCSGATGGTGVNGRTKVRVAMGSWDGYRGTYLAQQLRTLFAAGCDVKVLYGLAGASVRNVFATKTRRGYVPVHINGYDTDEDGDIDLYNHQKILTVSGHWYDKTDASFVWTGSSNWQNAGAKGDEIIFRVAGPNVVDRYFANFSDIWFNHSHLAKYIPYRTAYGRTTALYSPADAPQPSPSGPAWEND